LSLCVGYEVLALFYEERYGIYMSNIANIELLTTLLNAKVVSAAADIGSEAEIDGDTEAVIGDEAVALNGDDGTAIEGEAAGADAATTETSSDEIIMDETAGMEAGIGEVYIDGGVNIDPAVLDGINFDTGMMVDPAANEAKGSLLSSWPFVIGISAAVLLVSIALGALLARIKIKKGIELYED